MLNGSKRIMSFAAVVLLAISFMTPSLSRANVDVDIRNFSFVPQDVIIGVGDRVRWENFDNVNHTSTSDDGFWDSGIIPPGERFELEFNTVGEFPYHCTIHPSMTGIVTVLECICEVDMIPDQRHLELPIGDN